jgi:hypothetical protein
MFAEHSDLHECAFAIRIESQTGWQFGNSGLAAKNVFERRPTVDEIIRIIDVTQKVGSKYVIEAH